MNSNRMKRKLTVNTGGVKQKPLSRMAPKINQTASPIPPGSMSDVAPSPLPADESKEPTPDIPPIRMKRINYENLFTDKERSNQKRLA